MKKVIYACFLLVASMSIVSCEKEKEEKYLPEKCTVYYLDENNEYVYVHDTTFVYDDNLELKKKIASNESVNYCVYEYDCDKNGRIISGTCEIKSIGYPTVFYEFSYDEKGRIVSYKEENNYDNRKRITEKNFSYLSEGVIELSQIIDGYTDDVLTLHVLDQYVYTPLRKEENFDIYSYDCSTVGTGVGRGEYTGEMAVPIFKFQYDEKGNVIEKEWKKRKDMETFDLTTGKTFEYSSKVVYKYKNFSKK
ncbi:MAG: hypothetical protein IJ270_05615 [Paludibacteraceae bacterium]|nr:hypothetical protein [Paludibacteraceae bacterium]